MTFLVVTISPNSKKLILDVGLTFITMSTKFFNSEQLMFGRIWLSLLSQHNHTAGHTLSDNMWLSAVSAVMKQRSFYLLIINCNNYQDIIIIISIICKAHFLYKHANVLQN